MARLFPHRNRVGVAGARRKLVPYAGPIELRCRDRVGFASAPVEPSLGVIPMEGKADRKV